ncbi:hypothetical protein MJO28_015004 [Puccinia striiformis f. sp. tritici]|uniref:Uncharacterized protein n=1 Tax=Puccinia striiformis f. sp. tritici TaxID=168172 RepID=A0ACC0DST7_9BASI|nr:hypothetical protein MJO28_015004 [Puccinia striiformis f. sp. tritici]
MTDVNEMGVAQSHKHQGKKMRQDDGHLGMIVGVQFAIIGEGLVDSTAISSSSPTGRGSRQILERRIIRRFLSQGMNYCSPGPGEFGSRRPANGPGALSKQNMNCDPARQSLVGNGTLLHADAKN